MKKKVLLLHNQISPHTEGVFQHLAKFVDLEVLYCAITESNRKKWQVKPKGYKYQVLKQKKIEIRSNDLFTLFFNFEILDKLKKVNHDIVIIGGWDLPTYWISALYCWYKEIPYYVWSGSTIFEKSWRRIAGWPLVHFILNHASGYLAYGQRARDYLLQFGVDPLKIFMVMNGFDFQHYSFLSSIQKNKIKKIKKKHHLKNKTVILFYGQLIERKKPDLLIQAFQKISNKYPEAVLMIIGDGPLKEKLLKMRNSNQNIIILNNPGDQEIVPYYHLSDIFVLPSCEEVWGLAVNQAMAASLPVIASDRVGSVGDLIVEGVSGYVFEKDNKKSLISKIENLLINKSTRKIMGKNALKRVKRADNKQVAARIAEAINLNSKRKKNVEIEWINLPTISDDCKLTVAQTPQIKFQIKRVYYIYNGIKGLPRGFHAHKNTIQAIFCLQGQVTLTLDDGKNRKKVILDNPSKGVVINSMIWHEMHDINKDTVMLVLASEIYKPNDYIRDYISFKEQAPL